MILIGTLGGALIGFLSSIITIWITKHYEDKKAYRHILMETGLKNWEGAKELSKAQGGLLYPLDSFIIHQSKLIKLIEEDNLTKENLRQMLEESRELKEIFDEHAKKLQNDK